ncbi:MAG: cell division protein FtsQ/DivIB [Gammaproteobacteria bacterium]|nr:cell division protein FtsQ/DivIB [Gammaproteobacteria bacterium]
MAAAGQAASARKRVQAKPLASRWPLLAVFAGVLLLAASLVGAYQYLSQPGRLPLRVVEVKGELQHLSRDEVTQVAGAVIDGGFFSCDMQKLRNAILEIPWVDDVSIRRVWPDTLSMTVTEQVPVARWEEDGLINVRGEVFHPSSMAGHEGLVLLHGPAGSEQRVVTFLQAAVSPTRARGLHIREIELDQRRHWWVRFDDNLTLSLGRDGHAQRLAQFLRVYPRLAAEPQRRPERVDMRYAHGFAVRWQEQKDAPVASGQPAPQDKV